MNPVYSVNNVNKSNQIDNITENMTLGDNTNIVTQHDNTNIVTQHDMDNSHGYTDTLNIECRHINSDQFCDMKTYPDVPDAVAAVSIAEDAVAAVTIAEDAVAAVPIVGDAVLDCEGNVAAVPGADVDGLPAIEASLNAVSSVVADLSAPVVDLPVAAALHPVGGTTASVPESIPAVAVDSVSSSIDPVVPDPVTNVDDVLLTSDGEAVEPRYKRCLVCQKQCDRRIKRCKDCKGGRYCSSSCRDSHKPAHEELCGHIQELEKIEVKKLLADAFSVREENQVPAKIRNELVKLVGEKPLLHCSLDGEHCDGLWDTGSMVSMLNSGWLRATLPKAKMLTIEEFLEGDNLHLVAANNTDVNIEGVVVLSFSVGSCVFPVPFLVTKDELRNPIIGYNVIKHVARAGMENLPEALKDTIPSLGAHADAVISLLQSDSVDEEDVKVSRDVIVPPQSRCRVDCRTRFEAPVDCQNLLFTPYPSDMEFELSESVVRLKRGKRKVHVVVTNPTNSPLSLKKGLVLGSVESVAAVVPLGSGDESKRC